MTRHDSLILCPYISHHPLSLGLVSFLLLLHVFLFLQSFLQDWEPKEASSNLGDHAAAFTGSCLDVL